MCGPGHPSAQPDGKEYGPIKRVPPGSETGRDFFRCNGTSGSDLGYLHCLQAFRSLLDLELYSLSFGESLVPVAVDGFIMDEHVFTGAALDEAVALRIIEPLDSTLLHKDDIPYRWLDIDTK